MLKKYSHLSYFLYGLIFCGLTLGSVQAQEKPIINPAPKAKDFADLAKLPDWSGVWNPNISDQDKQVFTNMPPWKPAQADVIKFQLAEEKAGRPTPLFTNCLPESMPAWALITHNAQEFLFTPGRVTILGESDANRLRRIYTDGRKMPDDPELSFHGYSIGHWEGETLVVETRGIRPQTIFAVSEAAGVPNNGDVKIVERFHLVSKDVLHDDIEITAPNVLTAPWKTTREFFRQRARKFEIVEGVCAEGFFSEGKDKAGNDIFIPVKYDIGGNRIPPQ
jgi:hypothetical protein